MVTIQLPPQLRSFVDGRSSIDVDATTVDEAFRRLDAIAPMLRSQILDTRGNPRRFVSMFLGATQLVSIHDPLASDASGKELVIVMAVAGG